MTFTDLTKEEKNTLALVGIVDDASYNAVQTRIAADVKSAKMKEINSRYDALISAKHSEIQELNDKRSSEIASLE